MIQTFLRRLSRFRRLKHLALWITLIIFINVIILSFKPGYKQRIISSVTLASPQVETKNDLLNVDISRALKFQNWETNGFDKSLLEETFTKKKQPGFVSNLDIKKINSQKKKMTNHKNTNNKNDMAFFDDDSKIASEDGKYSVGCMDLQYNNTLEYYIPPGTLDIDYIRIRNELLNSDSSLAGAFKKKEEEKMTEEEIIKKRWHAFGTAAVWLESQNCYVAYTRLIYSIFENRARSYISVVVGQTFDKEWNEIFDKRIPFRDAKIPKQVVKKLNKLEKTLKNDECANLIDDKISYESCITKNNANFLRLQKEKEEILDKYSVKYPSVMNIPFTLRDRWNGPEDPHVILKKDDEGEEPVIIFNMATHRGRRVHAFMPHRKTDSLVDFDIEGSKMRNDEKNWAPFFHKDTMESSNHSPGYLHLVYDYNPLEIVRCSLLTGHCTFVFQAETLDIKKGSTDALRGGTQYINLPDLIPQVKGKNMWIGFAKSHVENCGCGGRFYRPTLTLLIEHSGIYHLELITPNIDYNEEVLGWDLKNSDCGGYNVLSPSSIANWHLVGQDPETGKFEDYLTMTISEADAISKRVVIKGIINYVLGIYEQKIIRDNFEIDSEASQIIGYTNECVKRESKAECKRYGLTHNQEEWARKEEEAKKKKAEEAKKAEEEKKKAEEEKKKKEKEEKKKAEEVKRADKS